MLHITVLDSAQAFVAVHLSVTTTVKITYTYMMLYIFKIYTVFDKQNLIL